MQFLDICVDHLSNGIKLGAMGYVGVLTTGLSVVLFSPLPAKAQYAAVPGVPNQTTTIYILGNDPATLQRVQSVIPGAFIGQVDGRQSVIAGVFNDQYSADRLLDALQRTGLPAQKTAIGSTILPSGVYNTSNIIGRVPTVVEVQRPATSWDTLPNATPISIPPTFSNYPGVVAGYGIYPASYSNYGGYGTYPPRYASVNYSNAIAYPRYPSSSYGNCPFNVNCPTAAPSFQPNLVAPTYIQGNTQVVQQPAYGACPSGYRCANNISNSSSNSGYGSSGFGKRGSYVVAVPARNNDVFTLQQVQRYVPYAYLARSRVGNFVYAGLHPNRAGAEAVSQFLRSQGLDSRVIYF